MSETKSETMSETTQDTALGERLATQIRTAGPMGVDSFMAACLGDASDGYYQHNDPFGVAGDFITAPEISGLFWRDVRTVSGAYVRAGRTARGRCYCRAWPRARNLDAGYAQRLANADAGAGQQTGPSGRDQPRAAPGAGGSDCGRWHSA